MKIKELTCVKLELDGDTATIALNRAARHNAIDPVMIDELDSVFKELEQDNRILFILLRGEGPSFCAGADIKWFAGAALRDKSENRKEYLKLAELLERIFLSSKITIAAVHGNALGGGNGLLAACDFVVAEESAHFAFGEVKLGIVPATILPFVAKRVSVQNLKKLMFSGDPFGAREAFQIGLVDFIAPAGHASQIVAELLSGLRKVSPNALKTCKKLITKVGSGEVGTGSSEYTAAVLAELVHSKEAREGLQAFLEKRSPDWQQLKTV